MRAKSIYSGVALLVSVLSCPNLAPAQGAPIDASVARQYFGEARAACERDGDKLWGMSICGPMLFVDPATRQKLIAEYRRRLVDGPTLLVPKTARGRVSFNSTNIVPLEGVGTVYPTATVNDEWGVMEVSNGALMVSEGGRITKMYASAPADLDARPLKGDGWTLQLNSGRVAAPSGRKSDYILKRPE